MECSWCLMYNTPQIVLIKLCLLFHYKRKSESHKDLDKR